MGQGDSDLRLTINKKIHLFIYIKLFTGFHMHFELGGEIEQSALVMSRTTSMTLRGT